jgi:uncharacterized protein YqhQ
MRFIETSNKVSNSINLGPAGVTFMVLSVVAANTFLVLTVLGVFSLWEAVIGLITLLILAAGTIWTIQTFAGSSRRPESQPAELEQSAE